MRINILFVYFYYGGDGDLVFVKGGLLNIDGLVRRKRASLNETVSLEWFIADYTAVVL